MAPERAEMAARASIFRRIVRRWVGYAPVPPPKTTRPSFVDSLSENERRVVEGVQGQSITSPERLVANMDAVRYVIRRGIPGALVECGVWRGGSVVSMIAALQEEGVEDRDIYLFDTFEGMTAPGEADTSRFEAPAQASWKQARAAGQTPWAVFFDPARFGLEQVRATLHSTGYPQKRLHFVVGRVEDTIPDQAPDEIAVLRLDTDWYESTKHELVHLYPRLAPGGVLIVDDYGHWDGCRRAVDEYFDEVAPPVLLARTDYTGRIAVKH